MLDKVTQIETIKYDRDVSYSYAASRLSTHWTNHNMAWSDFMQKLAQTVRTKEDLTEYNKMSKSEQADIKDVGGFVGGYLKEGKRRAGQVMNRSMLTLDIDYAAQDMTDILSMFYDFAYCLYSTHKHREISPRLRLVIPLKRNVNADEYEAIGRKVADIVGMDYFDDTTYQPHRLMYWPSTSNDAEFFFTYEDLPLLDPDKILNEYVDWTDTLEWPTSSREESKTKRLADKQGDPEEKPGIVGAFCRAYTIEEAIETFIPDLYEKHSTNRYTYHEGSTAGGLVLYENNKFAYSHHNTDPVSGMLVNSFDLVRIHLYGAQDDDANTDTPVNRLPSYKAMQQRAQNDEVVKKQLINDKMSDAMQDFDEIENNDDVWSETLEITSKGTFKASIPNIEIILRNDPNLKGKIAFNEFTKQIECLGKMPWNNNFKIRQWQDGDDSSLRSYIEKIYDIHHSGKTKDAIISVAMQNAYHPVRDYLNKISWDGHRRLEKLFIKYLGVEDTEVNRTTTKKALTAGIARVMEPGCKFDYMLTLYGPQGVGKSALLKKLGGAWFSDSLVSVTGKEAYEALQGVWLMEMAELAATRKAEVEAIKHFISKQVDRFRVAYGHYIEDFPRQCIFISDKERKLYDELEKHYILESEEEGTVVAQNGASLSQKLLQLSNGAVYTDDGDVREIHDKKLEKLEEIIEESQGQPILLFYNFKHDKERILERFKEATTLEDSNYKERWNSGNIKLLIAHPASAGHGLNLQQGGHIIVWFGLTWSLELYQQANARLYRQGQNHTTIIHHIMTDNTIDQRVYEALQNKELTQEELMKAIKARIANHK